MVIIKSKKDNLHYVNHNFWNSLRDFEKSESTQSMQETYKDFIYLHLLSKLDEYHEMLYKMKVHAQNIMGRDALTNDCVCKFTLPIFEKISSLMSEDEGFVNIYPFWSILLYHIDDLIVTAENICDRYLQFLDLTDNLGCDIIHKKVMEQCKSMMKKGYSNIDTVFDKAIYK